jgi:hypothetical protein
MEIRIVKLFVFTLIVSMIFLSCNEAENKEEADIEKTLDIGLDSSDATVFKFNNTLFSIPSPYQVAILIKELNLDFNKNILNSQTNAPKYTDNFKKALNFGVYGADLGYLSMYNQTADAVQYFSVLKRISQEVGLTGAFDKATIQRIEKNMSNKDSLLYILSNSYRSADAYLKDNNRNDIGVLILAGGWIESVFILTSVSNEIKTPNQVILNRIGEQKHPLDNLIKILSPYYNKSAQMTEFIDKLIDLAYEFDGIEYQYKYIPPSTLVDKKLTVINSESNVVFSKEQMDIIFEKVKTLRNYIIE